MTHLFLALFLLGYPQIFEYDAYLGTYRSTARKNQIAFVFTRSSVSGLVVEGVPIKEGVTFDIYGIYEGSLLLRIDYINSDKRQCVIKALIHNDHKSFIVASGFHLSYRLDGNNKPKDVRTFTFELTRR